MLQFKKGCGLSVEEGMVAGASLQPHSGSRERQMLVPAHFPLLFQSGTPTHGTMQPTLVWVLPPHIRVFGTRHHRSALAVKLAMKMNNHTA